VCSIRLFGAGLSLPALRAARLEQLVVVGLKPPLVRPWHGMTPPRITVEVPEAQMERSATGAHGDVDRVPSLQELAEGVRVPQQHLEVAVAAVEPVHRGVLVVHAGDVDPGLDRQGDLLDRRAAPDAVGEVVQAMRLVLGPALHLDLGCNADVRVVLLRRRDHRRLRSRGRRDHRRLRRRRRGGRRCRNRALRNRQTHHVGLAATIDVPLVEHLDLRSRRSTEGEGVVTGAILVDLDGSGDDLRLAVHDDDQLQGLRSRRELREVAVDHVRDALAVRRALALRDGDHAFVGGCHGHPHDRRSGKDGNHERRCKQRAETRTANELQLHHPFQGDRSAPRRSG
jgi:hypothetical protein